MVGNGHIWHAACGRVGHASSILLYVLLCGEPLQQNRINSPLPPPKKKKNIHKIYKFRQKIIRKKTSFVFILVILAGPSSSTDHRWLETPAPLADIIKVRRQEKSVSFSTWKARQTFISDQSALKLSLSTELEIPKCGIFALKFWQEISPS